MRYLNKGALGAVAAIGLATGSAAAAQQHSTGAPAVAPVGDATPPADMPTNAGPSGTSRTLAGPVRFDEVGYAAIAPTGSNSIEAWGTGLPASGFAEITDLATGKTILAKVSGRPALASGYLVDLSAGAAHLLGLGGKSVAQVRVRQVEPIAADQVALEQGRPAAPRLDAPPILLTGLRAQMAQVPPPGAAKAAATPAPTPKPAEKPAAARKPAAEMKPKAPAAPAKPAPRPAAAGKYHVRVGAFSSEANAKSLAAKLGGHTERSGKYWLVELGPFADAGSAKSARDGAAKRGYGDARVITD
ncbi:MAG: SPOR domain-containing protein [Sphingomonas sp.]